MMVDTLPAIRLTDPQAKDAQPNFPLSPENTDSSRWNPDSPPSRDGKEGRPTSPMSRAGAMVRSLSHNLPGASTKPQPSPTNKVELTMTVDPVTRQIYDRTGDMSPVMRHDSIETTHTHEDEAATRSNPPSPPRPALRTDTTDSRQHKSKDHRVSFFSRIMGGRKKETHDTIPDDASISEHRPEGHHAEVFSPAMRPSEFGRAQPQIPSYIRVRTRHSRKKKHFDSLFLAQELFGEDQPMQSSSARRKSAINTPEPEAAWAAEFSKDGKYLATAGHDKIVRVWAVIASPEERQAEILRTSDTPEGATHTAAVFRTRPIREYRGHTSTILDLSWSKNNFLLSSSMDKTVRLWHITRSECLCTFKHSDYVPTICFHPKDDRFFLAGSLDCKLRLWSIPEKHVAYWSQLPNMITAVSFTPEGKYAVAGCSDGSCLFYETEGLRYQTQVRVKSAQSKHSTGAKITGIHAFHHPPNTPNGDTKLLITSNDSRVRLYNFRDKSLEMKMKGTVNNTCQIRASISDDGRYISCGSEDKRAYIWPLDFSDGEDPAKKPVEHFQAHDSMVTCVRFAPVRTRDLLAKSSDPIFDICSPPSSILHGRDGADSESSSKGATDAGGSSAPSLARHKSESPSRLQHTQCSHHSGNIVVTASQTGTIKVFRQDCAVRYRLPRSNSYKRLSTMHLSKNSSSLRSKRSAHSLQSGRDTTSTHAPSDRILSWRQDINSSPSVRTNSVSSKHSTRSQSPRKSGQFPRSGQQAIRLDTVRKATADSSRTSSGVSTPAGSASQSPHLSSDLRMTAIVPKRIGSQRQTSHGSQQPQQQRPTSSPRAPQKATEPAAESPTTAEVNPLMLSGDQSSLYWNVELQKKFFERAHKASEEAQHEHAKLDASLRVASAGSLRPGGDLSRRGSAVSKLSIELSPSVSSSNSPSEIESAMKSASAGAWTEDPRRGRARNQLGEERTGSPAHRRAARGR